VSEIDLLTGIKAQLGKARELAVEGGWSTLLFFIDMAIMETDELTKKAMRTKLLAYVAEPDGEQAQDKLRRLAGRLEPHPEPASALGASRRITSSPALAALTMAATAFPEE